MFSYSDKIDSSDILPPNLKIFNIEKDFYIYIYKLKKEIRYFIITEIAFGFNKGNFCKGTTFLDIDFTNLFYGHEKCFFYTIPNSFHYLQIYE